MTGLDRGHPPCSCCSDAARSQWPLWSTSPCIWIWWTGSSCLGVEYYVPGWCYVQLRMTCLDEPDECASGAPWSWYQWNGQPAQCKLGYIRRVCMLYTPGVLRPRSSFTGQRKLAIFLSGRPTHLMLCLDSIRLKRLMCAAHSSPQWWRQYTPLKRQSTSTWLHGSSSQKTLSFILATVRTWNLTSYVFVHICLFRISVFVTHFSFFVLCETCLYSLGVYM
jgi:hypothetical protein